MHVCVSNGLFCFTVPPKIYDISSDITVNEGSNVSLICSASGKPEPKISWRHISPSGEFKSVKIHYNKLESLSKLFRSLLFMLEFRGSEDYGDELTSFFFKTSIMN